MYTKKQYSSNDFARSSVVLLFCLKFNTLQEANKSLLLVLEFLTHVCDIRSDFVVLLITITANLKILLTY